MSSEPITGDSPASNSHLKIEHIFWLPEDKVIGSLTRARENYDEFEGEVLLEYEMLISNDAIDELLKLTHGDISQAAGIFGVDYKTLHDYVTTTTELQQVMGDIQNDKDRAVLEGLSIGVFAIVTFVFVFERIMSYWNSDIGIATKLLLSVFTLYFIGGACYISFRAVRRMAAAQ